MITFVYAQDKNGAIGYKNDLPWHLPGDLKHFKETTMGHTMVMGRRTFEAMGKRQLPGRKSIVMTKQLDYGQDIEGLTVLHHIEEVLALAKDEEIMVIGGAALYQSFWPYVDKIIRTVILDTFDADTYLPEIDVNAFELIEACPGIIDAQNVHQHQYEWWQRKEGVKS